MLEVPAAWLAGIAYLLCSKAEKHAFTALSVSFSSGVQVAYCRRQGKVPRFENFTLHVAEGTHALMPCQKTRTTINETSMLNRSIFFTFSVFDSGRRNIRLKVC